MNERPVALVTGASRGIGAATAEELARRGYDVTVLARTGPDLDRTAKSVQDAGGKSLVQCGDLADLDFAEAAVAATVREFGRIDVLINNAAWREIITMRNISIESWDTTCPLHTSDAADDILCVVLGCRFFTNKNNINKIHLFFYIL